MSAVIGSMPQVLFLVAVACVVLAILIWLTSAVVEALQDWRVR